MDDHNTLRQPPHPNKGLMDVETSTPSSLEPTGRGGGPASSYMTDIHYRVTINLFTVGAPTTLSLTSHNPHFFLSPSISSRSGWRRMTPFWMGTLTNNLEHHHYF